MPTYQTPFITSLASPLGPRVFRKHALPFGRWTDAKGRTLTVDRPLLDRVVASFRAGALDQVPFQLAKDDNQHTDDPERFRGEIKGVEIGKDGLYVTAEMTPAGAELVKANPNLGVSVRLLGQLARGDGVVHRDVLGHVLGCMVPQAPGMRPWEQVALSAGEDEVIDLTAAMDAPPMALTDEDKTTIAAMIADALKADENEDGKEMSAAELQELADVAKAAELAAHTVTPPVELSAADSKRITDAEKAAEDAKAEARAATAHAAWRERRVELAMAGVPPALLDLAEPILSRAGSAEPATYDMAAADGKTVKVSERDVIAQLLAENRGRVDAVGREKGSAEFSADPDEAAQKRALDQLRAADPDFHRNGGSSDELTRAVAAGVTAALAAKGS
jgi:hypothetical protein